MSGGVGTVLLHPTSGSCPSAFCRLLPQALFFPFTDQSPQNAPRSTMDHWFKLLSKKQAIHTYLPIADEAEEEEEEEEEEDVYEATEPKAKPPSGPSSEPVPEKALDSPHRQVQISETLEVWQIPPGPTDEARTPRPSGADSSGTPHRTCLDDFLLKKVLGRGSFGKVQGPRPTKRGSPFSGRLPLTVLCV